MMRILIATVSLLIACIAASTCPAEPQKAPSGDWPWWRGPNFNGTSEAGQQPAVEWSETKNIVWKTAVPGRGHSSPTVVGNRILLTTADDQAQRQSVLCFNRATGKLLWKQDVNQGGFPARINRKNTHASSSIACDGQRLFAAFYHHDKIQLAALDFGGKLLWQRAVGNYDPQSYQNGYGASPLLYAGWVIIAGDFDGDGFLSALDRKTGRAIWNTPRPSGINYSSPVIAHIAGRDQLLISGCDLVASYNPQNGQLLWDTPATTMATAGTMVWEGDLVFAAGGFPKAETVCIRADGSGDVVWQNNHKIYEQSLLAHEGNIYAINDTGIALCWQADTGSEMWRQRLRGPISASPILAGGNIYLSNELGTTWVYRATSQEFTLIAQNQLGSEAFASPTICGHQIFLRVADQVDGQRQESLYCIAAADK